MPDLDSGHIFLTTLVPIKPGAPADDPQTSYEQRVLIALAKLPTAKQSPATAAAGFNSPFARNVRNHFTRMFVLNDVVYNGRITQNAIVALIKGNNQAIPRPVDSLKSPYLVFCADVDAITRDGDALPTELSAEKQREVRASYARELWNTMQEELIDLYSNCYGFEKVKSADDFAKYLDDCHVETTMPFHDYYLQLPKFHDLPLKGLGVAVLGPLLVAVISFLLWLVGMGTLPILGWSTLTTSIGALLLGLVAAYLSIRFAIKNGEKPLVPAKYDDLPSVLKSLYIQQKFSEFYIDQQGMSAQELYSAFGEFVEEHKPQNRHSKTQKPGVISSDDPHHVIS